jgi:hypothetical protein
MQGFYMKNPRSTANEGSATIRPNQLTYRQPLVHRAVKEGGNLLDLGHQLGILRRQNRLDAIG